MSTNYVADCRHITKAFLSRSRFRNSQVGLARTHDHMTRIFQAQITLDFHAQRKHPPTQRAW